MTPESRTPGLDFDARFAARVAVSPDAPALDDGGVILSYGELDVRIAELAERLTRAGLEPGQFGALTLDRGRADIIARLALLRLGCGFLPLPPQLPAERREFALALGHPALVIGPGAAPDRLKIERRRTGSPPARLDRAGWAILSSGTTGQPKLIQLRRDGLPALLDAQIPAFQLTPGDRNLSVLSLAFDATISDQLTTLAAGACLVFDPTFSHRSLAERLPRLGALGISQIDLPPALLARLPGPAPSGLKTLIIGGEVCPAAVIAARARELRVVVCYGPTEATICTSMVIHESAGGDGEAPECRDWIGRPIAGLTYRLAPDPTATRGELVIEGPAACSFYPGDEAERARRGPEGVFHTRDLVERVPDPAGCPQSDRWAFLGRLDRQLKIRGLLVAPEELERELERQPGVLRAAAVKVQEPTREALVAFITLESSAAGPRPELASESASESASEFASEFVSELGRALAQRLPGWMIPARMPILDALPETPTGKPDYAALAELARAPWLSGSESRDGEACPRSPAEPAPDRLASRTRALIALFRAVLGPVAVGPDTDFFDAGGDSLAALDLTALAERDGHGFTPSDLERLRRPDRLARALESPADQGDVRIRDELDDAARAAADAADLSPAGQPRSPDRASGLELGRELGPPTRLVTGATGRLGRRVLAELLRTTADEVETLVLLRGPPESARERLLRRLAELDSALVERARARLTMVPGDLAEPDLGLDPSRRAELARRCGTILHLGARVDLLAGFESLRRVNLDAVAALLRLAAEGRPTRLLHASTLSCFVAGPRFTGVAMEDDGLDSIDAMCGGYAQTKFAAERLLGLVEGPPVSILRYGLLLDPDSPRPDPRELFDAFITGLLELGAVPARGLTDLRFDLTPIQRAARATTALLKELETRPAGGPRLRRFHIAATAGVSAAEVVAGLTRLGHRLDEVPPGVWRARLAEAVGTGRLGGLAASACARLLEPGAFERRRSLDLFQATDMRFDTRRADAILRGSGLAAGPPRPEHLAALLARFATAPAGGVAEEERS